MIGEPEARPRRPGKFAASVPAGRRSQGSIRHAHHFQEGLRHFTRLLVRHLRWQNLGEPPFEGVVADDFRLPEAKESTSIGAQDREEAVARVAPRLAHQNNELPPVHGFGRWRVIGQLAVLRENGPRFQHHHDRDCPVARADQASRVCEAVLRACVPEASGRVEHRPLGGQRQHRGRNTAAVAHRELGVFLRFVHQVIEWFSGGHAAIKDYGCREHK